MQIDPARTLLDRIPALQRPCDLDLLVFFAKHPRTLIASEHLARLLGYKLNEIAQSLEGLLAAGLLTGITMPIGAADAPKDIGKAWSGTWNNRKYNTSGPLTCTVIGEENGQWIARFSGTALGKPISYTAMIAPKQDGGRTTLTGTTKIDGSNYQWSGAIAGKSLTGNYRAANGNNGEIRLQAK